MSRVTSAGIQISSPHPFTGDRRRVSSDWTYYVFWTIRPRPYITFLIISNHYVDLYSNGVCFLRFFKQARGGNGIGGTTWDDVDVGRWVLLRTNGGFFRRNGCSRGRSCFSKMSIQLYNYGEGWVVGRCLLSILRFVIYE
ncbi:hypothetical protein Hanom_Chr04g00367221 [Helianthus anomalus]